MSLAVLIQALSFAYEEDFVLSDVNLTIDEKEFIGIIGPNGGGKTTFLKLLLGLLKPTAGLIRIFGEPPKGARTKIAYVPQVMRCDRQFPISVMELVLGGRLSKASWWGGFRESDRQVALKMIERVGLTPYKDRSFGSLSGGQAQRALIARALASEPKLLLLDEPTASIDMQAEASVHQILSELKGEVTIIMVTHDIKAILHHVQRVFCIQREVSIISPEQVCEHFALGLYHPPLINSLVPKA